MAGPVVQVVQKQWYESKTVWLNVITMASLLGTILAGVKLSVGALETVGVIVAAANVALRLWFTGTPVTNLGAVIAAPKAP